MCHYVIVVFRKIHVIYTCTLYWMTLKYTYIHVPIKCTLCIHVHVQMCLLFLFRCVCMYMSFNYIAYMYINFILFSRYIRVVVRLHYCQYYETPTTSYLLMYRLLVSLYTNGLYGLPKEETSHRE